MKKLSRGINSWRSNKTQSKILLPADDIPSEHPRELLHVRCAEQVDEFVVRLNSRRSNKTQSKILLSTDDIPCGHS